MAGLRIWHRIHVRLTSVYGLALVLVLGPVTVLAYHLAVDSEVEGLRTMIRGITVTYASSVDAALLQEVEGDEDPYRVLLAQRAQAVMAESPRVASMYILKATQSAGHMAFVVDSDKRAAPAVFGQLYDITDYQVLSAGVVAPVVEAEPVSDAWGISLSGFAPIRDDKGAIIAVAGIDVDAARVDLIRERMLLIALGVSGGALLLLVFAGIGVGRMLRNPMARIVAGTEAIAEGRLETRVGVQRADEFGVLGRHFDRMAEGLEERDFIRSMFGRYVSEDVAKKLLVDRRTGLLRGEERRVTVLFSDLRSYTTISERLGPTQVLGLMNQYIEAMNTVVAAHSGCVLEYLGDGLLAVFGAPEDLPGHEDLAVRCAIAMRLRLAELNPGWDADGTSEAWRAQGMDALSARIGVHTGSVVAGSIGSEIRMKYTILGDTVNVASRIEGLNKELSTEVLLSHDTWLGLTDETRTQTVSYGDHAVKGRAQCVRVYGVRPEVDEAVG